eukprot:4409397-Pyramimonas_sp.AAC.1
MRRDSAPALLLPFVAPRGGLDISICRELPSAEDGPLSRDREKQIVADGSGLGRRSGALLGACVERQLPRGKGNLAQLF